MSTLLRVVLLIALPAVAFVAGGALMKRQIGRRYVGELLERRVKDGSLAKGEGTYLNMRLKGYTAREFRTFWNALDPKARAIEERFLEWDLVFPFLYGGALAASVLMAWAALGRPVHPAWVLLPVLALVAADWTENLVHIGQLRRWTAGGDAALQPGWIGVASTATMLKWAFTAVSVVTLCWLLWNLATRRPAARAMDDVPAGVRGAS